MSRTFVDYYNRRGTAARWTEKNPILASGEIGYETDTNQFKIGNGLSRWNDLPYFIDEDAIQALLDAGGGAGADTRIGDMALLTTTEKGTVVGAINEVNVPPVPLDLLYSNAKAG